MARYQIYTAATFRRGARRAFPCAQRFLHAAASAWGQLDLSLSSSFTCMFDADTPFKKMQCFKAERRLVFRGRSHNTRMPRLEFLAVNHEGIMRAVSDDVTEQILNHGVGYVAWKIAQDASASDASRRKIIEEFLRDVPILVASNAFKGNLSARDVNV